MVYELYSRVYQTNIMFSNNSSEKYIHIPTDSDFSKVVNILVEHGLLININSFEWLAKQKKYYSNIKPGRYKIDRALNNNELVNLLRSGEQTPIKVTFNNLRTKEQLAAKVGEQIEADSLEIIQYITDVLFQKKLDLNDDNVSCIFLPNTYEFYWNTSAEEFVSRMLKEYSVFWNSSRKAKADANKAEAPFWVFTGSSGGLTTVISQSVLVMSSSNMNEAYGTGFKQGDLEYFPGPSDYFPGNVEPAGTNFEPIYLIILLYYHMQIQLLNDLISLVYLL